MWHLVISDSTYIIWKQYFVGAVYFVHVVTWIWLSTRVSNTAALITTHQFAHLHCIGIQMLILVSKSILRLTFRTNRKYIKKIYALKLGILITPKTLIYSTYFFTQKLCLISILMKVKIISNTFTWYFRSTFPQ